MKAPKLLLVFFTFINLIYSQQPQHSNKVIGYYAQWAIYTRDYNVLEIEADKLTHLLYAFYNPVYDSDNDTASLQSLDEYADYEHNESGLLTASISNLSTSFKVLINNQQLQITNISKAPKITDIYLFDLTGKQLIDIPNHRIESNEVLSLNQSILSNTFYICILKTEDSIGVFKIISK